MYPDKYLIRPLIQRDIPHLTPINPTFTANTRLQVQRQGTYPFHGWQLNEVLLEKPFDKKHGYDFDTIEQENIRQRLQKPHTLLEVVVDKSPQTLVGILDVEEESWRQAAWIWNIMLDVSARGEGLGRHLIQRTIDWAKQRRLRAILLETQSNNTPACHFYAHLGFKLVGINDMFYTNQDIEQQEVALFWGYAL